VKEDIRIEDLSGEFRQLAEDIGLSAALKLVDARGGESIYIPPRHRIMTGKRDREMYEKYMRNVPLTQLCKEYDMSETRIRTILNEIRSQRQRGLSVHDLLNQE